MPTQGLLHSSSRASTMDATDDAALLKAVAQRRDQDAFLTLVSRYEQGAFSMACNLLANKDDAVDAVQEAMLDVWLSASSFQAERGKPGAWISRIVANRCINLAKKRNRIRRLGRNVEKRETLEPAPLPAETAAWVVSQLLTQGRVRRWYLGITGRQRPMDRWVAQLYELTNTHLVEVMFVEPKGPAARAGMAEGDLILAVNDRTVASVDDLHRVLAEWPPKPATLKILRGLDRLAMRVIPTEAP